MAVDMFVKIGDIKGESKDATHKETIDVLAWSWGLSQSGSFSVGAGGGAGKVSVQDISITKYVDSATTALIVAACKGTHIKQAVLTVRKAGDKPLEYIKITLDSVLVSSLSTGGSGGEDRLTENLSLNFAKFKVEYTKQAETGGKDATSTAAWDITANEPVG
jgi:type VI secretion system secreted protein Hcp